LKCERGAPTERAPTEGAPRQGRKKQRGQSCMGRAQGVRNAEYMQYIVGAHAQGGAETGADRVLTGVHRVKGGSWWA
jgi:hypothetical protein